MLNGYLPWSNGEFLCSERQRSCNIDYYTLQICISNSMLFWCPTALHREVLEVLKFSNLHSSSLATLVCTSECSKLNSLAAWKAGMKVLSQRLHQILKTVHMLKQSFPHGLSLRDSHFWTLGFVPCLHIQL